MLIIGNSNNTLFLLLNEEIALFNYRCFQQQFREMIHPKSTAFKKLFTNIGIYLLNIISQVNNAFPNYY